MDDFVLRAVLAGLGVAAVAGPLGSFVVWRRMAYFGDTLAHSALLGVALGILLGVNLNLAVVALCIARALLRVALQQQRRLPRATLLGIMSRSAPWLGLAAEGMGGLGGGGGAIGVLGGVAASLRWDLPTGPAIVLSGSLLFALSLAWPRRLSVAR